jgi:hypothetical protein
MSPKMITKVFAAFWKFTFQKCKADGDVFEINRRINREMLEIMLGKYCHELCEYIDENKTYFNIAENSSCLANVCVLLAFFPQVYKSLDETVKHQIKAFKEQEIRVIKWFETGDIEEHLNNFKIRKDYIPTKLLEILDSICKKQGQSTLFIKFLINYYSKSNSFAYSRDCFDYMIEPFLHRFSNDELIHLIETINSNNQIYGYSGQRSRNNIIMLHAQLFLPEEFDYSKYEKFRYTKLEELADDDPTELDDSSYDIDSEFSV